MITRIFFFVWSLFIFSETAAQSGQDWGEIFAKLYQEVKTHSAAYRNLEWATQHIGHRLTGSQNGAAAEEYAYNLLRSYGLD
ncbi:MAG: aminopeptidase, partial [Chitinophagaceae bacterium]|nr:aminopeptidase [Chitinophagaceae bacterium]